MNEEQTKERLLSAARKAVEEISRTKDFFVPLSGEQRMALKKSSDSDPNAMVTHWKAMLGLIPERRRMTF